MRCAVINIVFELFFCQFPEQFLEHFLKQFFWKFAAHFLLHFLKPKAIFPLVKCSSRAHNFWFFVLQDFSFSLENWWVFSSIFVQFASCSGAASARCVSDTYLLNFIEYFDGRVGYSCCYCLPNSSSIAFSKSLESENACFKGLML